MLDNRSDSSDVSRRTGTVFTTVLGLNEIRFENEADYFRLRLGGQAGKIAGALCLDAGCGRGEACFAMAELGARRVIGYDIGEHLLSARQANAGHANVLFVRGDVLELPFSTASFDVVHSSGVLHHTTDPARGFAEFVRVLKPGGLLYVAVVGHEGLQLIVTQSMRGLARVVPLRAMSRLLSRFLPYWVVVGLLDVGYATIRRTYFERDVRRWFETWNFGTLARTRSERYDYRSPGSRLWWGVGWIQISGVKPGAATVVPAEPAG